MTAATKIRIGASTTSRPRLRGRPSGGATVRGGGRGGDRPKRHEFRPRLHHRRTGWWNRFGDRPDHRCRCTCREGALTIAIVTKPFALRASSECGSPTWPWPTLPTASTRSSRSLTTGSSTWSPRTRRCSMRSRVVDDVLLQAVQGIIDLLKGSGLVNVDFADVRAVMHGAGAALVGLGASRQRRSSSDSPGRPSRPSRPVRARRQGRGAEPGCRGVERGDRRLLRRECALAARGAAQARPKLRRSGGRLRHRASVVRSRRRDEPRGRLLAVRALAPGAGVAGRVGHGRQRADLRSSALRVDRPRRGAGTTLGSRT